MESLLQTALAVVTFFKQQLILPTAPLATNGIHLLLNNDVDSSTGKNAFILLSHPRDHQEGMTACLTFGDGKIKGNPTQAKTSILLNCKTY